MQKIIIKNPNIEDEKLGIPLLKIEVNLTIYGCNMSIGTNEVTENCFKDLKLEKELHEFYEKTTKLFDKKCSKKIAQMVQKLQLQLVNSKLEKLVEDEVQE